jgi:hypothetical protein
LTKTGYDLNIVNGMLLCFPLVSLLQARVKEQELSGKLKLIFDVVLTLKLWRSETPGYTLTLNDVNSM